MTRKMLIDASHPEETRVVVMCDNSIEEFDFESENKKQLKGNIYLARVTRVEPSLQAAFVEYGKGRQGFLAFSEIHPDYYQIPLADRQAILRIAEQAEHESATESLKEQNPQDKENTTGTHKKKNEKRRRRKPTANLLIPSESKTGSGEETHENTQEEVVTLNTEDPLEEVKDRHKSLFTRPYKIQEVIKSRQILLLQVVKEERGHKGASLTTYLSLAGRYSVLMPNTPRGGGISKKITNPKDRDRLKSLMKDLEIPQGMGIILRTAGESKTKAEIRRDYEYLIRLWENIRNLTLCSTAPSLIHEEGNLIKRSIRDLYKKDIMEILVSGEKSYREAKDFMRMLAPSHTKIVQRHKGPSPLFAAEGIETLLDQMVEPEVTLPSGGHIVINQTEALVAIDVNSGRSTREHSIEDTAVRTNLEAAEEIARQLRLRDLAGLIVADFIDMEESRNRSLVEKKLKECLKNDRARIQTGRISHFGLLEMSRQRIRSSILESTMKTCPRCSGAGHVRPDSSLAILVLRAIEESLIKNNNNHLVVQTAEETVLYILNNKRDRLEELEKRFDLKITFSISQTADPQTWNIIKGQPVERISHSAQPESPVQSEAEPELPSSPPLPIEEKKETKGSSDDQQENNEGRKRKHKYKRSRRRNRNHGEKATGSTTETVSESAVNNQELESKLPAEKPIISPKAKQKENHTRIIEKKLDDEKLRQSTQEKTSIPHMKEEEKKHKIESDIESKETKDSIAVPPKKGWWQRKGFL